MTTPHNLDAEKAVLGAILLDDRDNGTYYEAAELVTSFDFYDVKHQRIFAAMRRIARDERKIDGISVGDELARSREMDAAGGNEYLADLLACTATTANAGHHATIIKEKAQLRALINAAHEIGAVAAAEKDSTAKILERAQSSIYAVASRTQRKTVVTMEEAAEEVFEMVNEAQKNGGQVQGIKSGITEVDDLINGFEDNLLYIVGARPAMGKTALATGVALNAATVEGKSVYISSLEMSANQLVLRATCAEAGISTREAKRHQMTADQWKSLTDAIGRINKAPIVIDEESAPTIEQLRGRVMRAHYQGKADLLIVDYMQLMNGGGNAENRQQEISNISRGLKGIAKDLKIPVIALSQLSRECEKRVDKRPMLADLRESGAIEQDADVVMFLYRGEVYAPEDTTLHNTAELIVAKQRDGPTGRVNLYFDKRRTTFTALARDSMGREAIYG